MQIKTTLKDHLIPFIIGGDDDKRKMTNVGGVMGKQVYQCTAGRVVNWSFQSNLKLFQKAVNYTNVTQHTTARSIPQRHQRKRKRTHI